MSDRARDRSTPGHVFVVQGDLARLSCDDVLVPTDAQLNLTRGWWSLVPDRMLGEEGRFGRPVLVDPPGTNGGARRLDVDGPRRTWLVDTASADPDELADAVRRFFRAVLGAGVPEPRNGRERPLIGLPLVGTGEGGAGGRRGDVIGRLFPVLREVVDGHGVDVALVLKDRRDHSAAQEVRRREEVRWPLDDELLARADALAEQAVRGELALFVGAGVSRAAGLPMWKELLDELAGTAGRSAEERVALAEMPPPDAAELLLNRLGAERFAREITRLYHREEHALAHALLASLPVSHAVTTNFDPLFELAAAGAGRELSLVPAVQRRPGEPWLVKLHGDIRRPADVVLTRESFLRLADEQSALTGVVQALLLTKHMLFVGFSLLDDTFIRVAHQARRVIQRAAGAEQPTGRVGTALGLTDEPLRRELWQSDLDYVAVAPSGTEPEESARLLEVFLDRLAASASSRTGWLLDSRYAGLRTAEDATLADALERMLRDLPDDARGSHAWQRLEALLGDLGRSPVKE